MLENAKKTGSAQDPVSKRKTPGRSTHSYPYFDLNLSLEVPKVIHEKGGGTCTADQLAAFLNYKTTKSGTYQTRFSAAKQFGLIRSENSNIVVTERAQQILSPVMPGDSENAKADAFLSVELFSEIFEKYRGGTIPPEAGLKNLLMQSYGFSQDRVGPAIRVLLDSAEQAGFFNASGDRSRLIKPSVQVSGGATTTPKTPLADQPLEKPRLVVGGNDGPAGVHSAIIGLLRDLPAPGTVWPSKQKARFVKAFQATLDFIYPSDENDEISGG
jgi:hypothetical protein